MKEKALLQVGYKTYKVHKGAVYWVISKTQMLNILKITHNNDFLFNYHTLNEDYKILDNETKEWIIQEIKQHNYNISYNEEENVFEFSYNIIHFHLKPNTTLSIAFFKL
ncbi:MAG: hypothetical protein QXL51_01480 [Candidatus Aenigmatarchaeota archaeon]